MAKKLADKGCVIVALDVNVKGNEATVEEIRFGIPVSLNLLKRF